MASSSQALVNARCAVLRTFWLTLTLANNITTRTFQSEHGAATADVLQDRAPTSALASISPLNCWPSWLTLDHVAPITLRIKSLFDLFRCSCTFGTPTSSNARSRAFVFGCMANLNG